MLADMKSQWRWIPAVAATFLLASCGDDDNDSLVTITGVVRNLDNGFPAAGIRVTLYGTDYSDEAATGADGAYLLKVPKGSVLTLLADDFDPGQDIWIPFINVDAVQVVANGNVETFSIHGCPHTTCKTPPDLTWDGSIAIWDNYLQNYDSMNGDIFVPTRVRDSAGTIVVATGDCARGDSMSVTTNRSEFPVGYIIFEKMFSPPAPIEGASCGAGADIFYPPTRSTTDDSGFALCIGDPAFTGTTVTLTFADRTATPTRPIPSPLVVPVQPGALTFVWGLSLDGVPATIQQYGCECWGSTAFCQ